ncbi:XRE family transcriptional regulator [Brevundimonas sp.]|uniref:XRE family transcriptional regulator n=1 Tax=Brevundimonas sp. TaxID=1871086 RepID=UPI003F7041EA
MSDNHQQWDGTTNFDARLREAMGPMQQVVLAKRADITTSKLSRILQGAEPSLQEAVRLARAVKADLIWLATGRGSPNAAAGGFVTVPIYDVRLAAGVASFAEAAEQIGEMPFDTGLLQDLGVTSTEGLAVFTAEGDSMSSTIRDGARVLANLKDTRLRDGIFAFRTGEDLRIKRLRRRVDGIEILSDNEHYPAELVTGDAADEVTIIGRVLWAGSVMARA